MITALWRVTLFGGLRAERAGMTTITRFRTQKTGSLFALLCCHPGRMFGREELIALFWPEDELSSGRNSLRVSLASLRRVLEPPPVAPGSVLISTTQHVQLRREAIETDIAAYEAALESFDITTAESIRASGPFLPGVYDDWAVTEAERLTALAEHSRLPSSLRLQSPAEAVIATTIEAPPEIPVTTSLQNQSRLPYYLSPFVGRDEEIGRLEMLLADPNVRLITIAGPGGVGKTRLALESVRRLLHRKGRATRQFPAGVIFVPLVVHKVAGEIAQAICEVVSPPGSPDALDPLLHPKQRLESHFGDRRAVFVLDNLEQIAAADLSATLSELLQLLPGVVCLCTSRRRVGLRGERLLRLGPLPTPGVDDPLSTVAMNPAVALFADRAREADADFGLTTGNFSCVSAICERLGGLPLAIELAAGWANVFSPKQMLERLEESPDSFDADTRRTLRGESERRHHSLGAVVAWSCNLLTEEARRFFERLSVFAGSFTLESAMAVTDIPSASDHLARLLDHSLITIEPSAANRDDDRRRFVQITVLREIAASRMPPEQVYETRLRHATWFASVAAATQTEALLVDADNLNAALAFREESAADSDSALQLAVTMTDLWWKRGQWRLGWETLSRLARKNASDGRVVASAWRSAGQLAFHCGETAISHECFVLHQQLVAEDAVATAYSHIGQGASAIGRGDWDTSRRHLEIALAYYRSVPPCADFARALANLAHIERAQNSVECADALTNEALAIYRNILDDAEGTAICTSRLGDSDRQRGDALSARRRYADSLDQFRAIPIPYRIAQVQSWLADMDLEDDNPAEAILRIRECLRILRSFDNPGVQSSTLEALARLSFMIGRPREAARFLGAANRLRIALAVRLPLLRARWETLYNALHSCLGKTRFHDAFQEGERWTTVEALARAEKFEITRDWAEPVMRL